jgi:hypothetical protein
MKGKWAQGIKPRNFAWVIKDRLAVCERPGGYGVNHRKVRRQEEIIWVREQGFTKVISVIGAPHNLHNYDEMDVSWLHRPFPTHEPLDRYLAAVLPEIKALLSGGEKLLVHGEELGDRVQGLMAAFLRWTGMVADDPTTLTVIERLLGRQLGPQGRELVAMASSIPGAATPSAPA